MDNTLDQKGQGGIRNNKRTDTPGGTPKDTNEASVLVYDPERRHAGNLQTILQFLGHDVALAFDPDGLAERLQEADNLLTVIVAGNLAETEQQQVAQQLSRLKSGVLPIVLFKPPATDSQPLVLGYPPNWIVIQLPLAYAELSNALQRARAHLESQLCKEGRRPSHLFRSLIGRSPAIQKIRQEIEQAGPTDANVLILGESGTGKEVVARNLHYYSKRREGAFVPVNCGAIPKDLLESELFGHEKGAFTGALTAREGRFALAAGGTLFLDEIGEMPMDMQVKLLRVLEERVFEKVGGNKSIKADVRIVAATNCNLEQMVKEGKFREDLYYRLEVFPINLPPLRERIEDLPLLISQLNERLEFEKQCSVRFSPDAIMTLSRYYWPGNVRELANLIERLAIQYPYGLVQAKDLPVKYRLDASNDMPDDLQLEFFSEQAAYNPPVAPGSLTPQIPPGGLDLKSYVSEVEMNLISQALEEAGGVVAHAAKLLGLRRTTLTEKMRKYGLQRPHTNKDKEDH